MNKVYLTDRIYLVNRIHLADNGIYSVDGIHYIDRAYSIKYTQQSTQQSKFNGIHLVEYTQ